MPPSRSTTPTARTTRAPSTGSTPGPTRRPCSTTATPPPPGRSRRSSAASGTSTGRPTWRWIHVADPPEDGTLAVDPATVLGELRSSGQFEEVGHEPVDGVDVTRLRSTDPSQLPRFSLGYGLNEEMLGPITSLEVWVDGREMVRRFELTFGGIDGPDVLPVNGAVVSIRFFDFGAPITIQAPTDYQEWTGW
jgi:hypothetical protein